MLKFITAASIAALALTVTVAPQPAQARDGAIAAGVIGGLAVGAIVGSQVDRGYRDDGYYRSGYRGRVGLYEVMKMTPEIQALALERAPAEAIRDVAVEQGMLRLRDDGLQKVRQGRTSIAEIARVVGSG